MFTALFHLSLWFCNCDVVTRSLPLPHKRVMPSSFFLLQRFFLRVDGVLIKINDTRLYYEDGKNYMLREFSTRENTIAELKYLCVATRCGFQQSLKRTNCHRPPG
ncbi:hypothetical protein AMECASPLE_035228 [Ameca splendens]|uniref:TIP41-like protein n=1 Tax=Ameca splendens TaxID=208324 RepID=A0ABV1AGB6_9TELE